MMCDGNVYVPGMYVHACSVSACECIMFLFLFLFRKFFTIIAHVVRLVIREVTLKGQRSRTPLRALIIDERLSRAYVQDPRIRTSSMITIDQDCDGCVFDIFRGSS